jgi:hypothetical protein
VFDDSGFGEWLKAEQKRLNTLSPDADFQTAWPAATALDAQRIQSQLRRAHRPMLARTVEELSVRRTVWTTLRRPAFSR